jgi:hypothetical protein
MLKKFKKTNRGSNLEGQPRDEGVHNDFPPLRHDLPFHP